MAPRPMTVEDGFGLGPFTSPRLRSVESRARPLLTGKRKGSSCESDTVETKPVCVLGFLGSKAVSWAKRDDCNGLHHEAQCRSCQPPD